MLVTTLRSNREMARWPAAGFIRGDSARLRPMSLLLHNIATTHPHLQRRRDSVSDTHEKGESIYKTWTYPCMPACVKETNLST
jgi:hypothetical protein